MSRVDWVGCLVFGCIMGVIGLGVGFTVGGSDARSSEQRKAIAAGVGRWVIGPDTGVSRFVYGKDGDE